MRACLVLSASLVALSACAPDGDFTWNTPKPATVVPVFSKKIVLVIAPGQCRPCDMQKQLLAEMKQRGELSGVAIETIEGGNETYPANAYPTLYICSGQRCHAPFVGFTSRERILELLK